MISRSSGSWWKTRAAKVWRVKPGDPEAAPSVALEYSFEDRYSDPGEPLLEPTARGTEVLVTANDGATVFLSVTVRARRGIGPSSTRWTWSLRNQTALPL